MSRLSGAERAVLRELSAGMPEGPRPYAVIAERAGLGEEAVLESIRDMLERGIIRRMSAILHDRGLGYEGNAMVVWRVRPEEMERAGTAAAARPEISHAYSRRTTPEWRYNFYTMIHARTREEALAVADELDETIRAVEHKALFTVREFTKRRPTYSVLWDDDEPGHSEKGSDK